MSLIDSPDAAIDAMTKRLSPLPSEMVPVEDACGLVLAQEIVTDRPSPPSSVSAMDGYAIRLEDAAMGTLPVSREAKIGQAPPEHAPETATRIYTGSPVPASADCVIKREDVREVHDDAGDRIEIGPESAARLKAGLHVRFVGENAPAGMVVLRSGDQITPTAVGALTTFGVSRVEVCRQVRVGVLVTGDELAEVDAVVDEFTIRDSNGPAVASTVDALPWAYMQGRHRVGDVESSLEEHVRGALESSDAVILTGGVSMGRYDFVPNVLERLGCETVFHKLPQRPGRPMLGAIGPSGQAVLALPGNPVSVLCTLHRVGVPVLRRLAGFGRPCMQAMVELESPPSKPIPLWWYRAVRLTETGRAALIENKGSGDMASIAGSDGFVQLEPSSATTGPWPYWPWQT